MAISPEQSLLDLAARTATADSDLILVNSGGTDYKQTKQDFLQGDFYYTFANDTLITTQADSLATGRYFGTIASYGHQSETGVPVNSSFYVHLINYGGNYKIIYLTRQATGDVYFKAKVNGTWQADWTQEPTREEMDRIKSDLASITAGSSVTLTVANNSRIILFATGGADSRCGAWHIFVASNGGVAVSPIGTVGSYVSASSSGANKIVVSNTTSGSGSAYLNAIVFAGSIS
ncbi:MAG: hypothetical protein IJM83_08455 [Firmicutes bacterium]|nr:hypothetical protein [Bacillota bacterium]